MSINNKGNKGRFHRSFRNEIPECPEERKVLRGNREVSCIWD